MWPNELILNKKNLLLTLYLLARRVIIYNIDHIGENSNVNNKY